MSNEEVFFESPITDRYITCKPGLFKSKTIDQSTYVKDIIKTILDYFGYKSIKEISIKSRKEELVYIRKVCFYFLNEQAKLTMSSIGRMFGGKDHTTVIHGLQSLSNLIETKDQVRHDIYTLKSKIGNGYVVINKMKREPNKKKRKKIVPPPVPVTVIKKRSVKKKHNHERFKQIEIVKLPEPVPFQRPPAIYSNRKSFYDLAI